MKIIFLIISGADKIVCADRAAVYKSFYSLSRLYYEKMKKTYDFDYFYVEYKEMVNEIEEEQEFLYIKGTEEFSKIYDKTIIALNYINNKYVYDYVVRTNLSSFWNIHNLFKMATQFPIEKCLTGVLIANNFISGTGIIMSRDVGRTLAMQKHTPKISDDVLISTQLKQFYKIHRIDETAMYYLISEDRNVIPDNKEHILYFRIKNLAAQYDILLFNILLFDIYGIKAL